MRAFVCRANRNRDERLGVWRLDSRGREEVRVRRERFLDELHLYTITKTYDRDPAV